MSWIRKLTGRKCFLSPINFDDAEIYTHWLNDMEVAQYLTLATEVINMENERKFLSELANRHNYGIVDLESDKLIGTCGFENIESYNRCAEIGIFIGDKNFWNKGYGTESMRLLIEYGFNYLNLRNISLRVYAFNDKAIACYKKIGFKEVGYRREAMFRNGAYHDVLLMDLLSDDFLK